MKTLEKIFSIKNDLSKTHKVINILGIVIKYKIKNPPRNDRKLGGFAFCSAGWRL